MSKTAFRVFPKRCYEMLPRCHLLGNEGGTFAIFYLTVCRQQFVVYHKNFNAKVYSQMPNCKLSYGKKMFCKTVIFRHFKIQLYVLSTNK